MSSVAPRRAPSSRRVISAEQLGQIMSVKVRLKPDATFLLRLGKLLEQRLGLRQRDARVRNALAIHGVLAGHIVLPPFDEMALEHRPENLPAPRRHLFTDRRGDIRLLGMVLETVPCEQSTITVSRNPFAASRAQTLPI